MDYDNPDSLQSILQELERKHVKRGICSCFPWEWILEWYDGWKDLIESMRQKLIFLYLNIYISIVSFIYMITMKTISPLIINGPIRSLMCFCLCLLIWIITAMLVFFFAIILLLTGDSILKKRMFKGLQCTDSFKRVYFNQFSDKIDKQIIIWTNSVL